MLSRHAAHPPSTPHFKTYDVSSKKIGVSTKRTKHICKQAFLFPSREKKTLAYLARCKNVSPPRTPNSMLTPDLTRGVVEKETLVSVLALAASQPNIEVGGAGGIQHKQNTFTCSERFFLSRRTAQLTAWVMLKLFLRMPAASSFSFRSFNIEIMGFGATACE